MLLYYPFWMFIGFTLHFYIILGTNLLTGGPTRIVVFCLFQCFKEKEYQTESKRNETFLEQSNPEDLECKSKSFRGVHEGGGRAPISRAPRASTDVLLPPIYTHVPRKHQGRQRKTISTIVTFCIHEIPSWSLRRCSTGGGIDHGGPLHHLQGLSDEL